MQIVIDIPEELYKRLTAVRGDYYLEDGEDLCGAVQKGTPLPKGHGRLVDIDLLKNQFPIWIDTFSSNVVNNTISKAPIIVEADKADSEINLERL